MARKYYFFHYHLIDYAVVFPFFFFIVFNNVLDLNASEYDNILFSFTVCSSIK